jgi:aspartate/methionine/tyrosine aminotransferase
LKVSERTSGVEYAIRDIILHAKQHEKSGKEIIYLNIGDPVRFDFKTPDHIKMALIDAVNNEENYYAESEGIPELRKAIVEKENEKGLAVVDEDVIISNGVSEGLDMVLASVIDPNSEVLMPGPYYPPYASYVKFYGGKPIEFQLHQNGGIDVDDIISKISPRSRAICIINPNNPTGEVFDKKNLQKVIDLAAEHDLYLICDEIYDKIVFDEQFVGIGRVSKEAPVILLNGFSKSYLMTGWRCGYICLNSESKRLEPLRTNIPKLARVRIASNLPVQLAAVQALRGPQDHIKTMVEKLKRRRDYTVKRLNSIDGIRCKSPHGAFYVFPELDLGRSWKDDKEFVLDFFDSTGVLTVNGSGFGTKYGSSHFRAVYLPSEDVLEKAMDKLEDFMKRSAA